MALTRHMLRKDFRAERWLLLGWILFSMIEAVNRVLTPRLQMDTRYSGTASMWGLLLWLADWLFLLAFVAHHIQAEPLVGTTAFWLTRPVPRRALFVSKLAGLCLFVTLPGLVVEIGLLAVFHVPVGIMVAALIQQALNSMLLMLVLAFAASVTSSTIRLLQLVIGTLIGLVVLGLVLALVFADIPDLEPIEPRGMLDPTSQVIALVFLMLGLAIALGYHYASRRRAIAVLLFVVAFFAADAAGEHWPRRWSLFGGAPTIDASWARDPTVSRLRLASDDRLYAQSLTRPGRQAELMLKVVAAPVVLDALPTDYTVSPFTREARLEFDDGRVIHSERGYGQRVRVSAATARMLPRADVFTVPSRYDEWPVLMRVPQEVFQEDGRRPGRYTGTFDFIVTRHVALAVLPVAVGAGYVDGPRSVTIADTVYRLNRCSVTLGVSTVMTWTSQLSDPKLVTHFRRRDDGLALHDNPDFEAAAWANTNSAPVRMQAGVGGMGGVSFWIGSTFLPNPFQLTYQIIAPTNPVAVDPSKTSPSGPACDQMEMVVERTTYAGRLTRMLEIPDFRMDDEASAR